LSAVLITIKLDAMAIVEHLHRPLPGANGWSQPWPFSGSSCGRRG